MYMLMEGGKPLVYIVYNEDMPVIWSVVIAGPECQPCLPCRQNSPSNRYTHIYSAFSHSQNIPGMSTMQYQLEQMFIHCPGLWCTVPVTDGLIVHGQSAHRSQLAGVMVMLYCMCV